MFKSMRKNAKIVFYIIAGVFIFSMGFMGLGGRNGIFSNRSTVGVIAGKKIQYSEFNEYFTQYYGNWLQQHPDQEPDDKKLNDEAWDKFVAKKLYDMEIKRRHIKVTTQDELDRLENPSDDIKSIKQFQTNGKFDKEKYLKMMDENIQFANAVVDNIHQTLPYEKLFDAVKAEVTVTDEEVKEDYIKKNDKADVKIIYFDYKKAEKPEITDDEIKKYYDEHKEDYKEPPARKLKYVKIVIKPSSADSLKAKAKADSIYQLAIKKDADFAELAKEYSEGPTGPKGGDLGYFTFERMVKPFSEAAFSMKVGEVSKPVLTRFGYHIIKVFDKRKNKDKKEEVKASHILIKIEPSEKTKEELEKQADDFAKLAKEKGFEEAAKEMNLKVDETKEFNEKSKFIPGIGRAEELVKFAFSHKKSDITEPKLINKKEYVIAQVSYVVGDHYKSLEDAKASIKRKLESEKKREIIQKQAEEFMKKYPKEKWLEMAKKEGWEIVEAKDITKEKYISKIGKVDDLLNAIFKTEEGQFTELVKTKKGTYLAYVEKRNKPDMEKFEKEKEKLKEKMLNEKQNKHLSEWWKKLKEDAKIIDKRKDFYPFL